MGPSPVRSKRDSKRLALQLANAFGNAGDRIEVDEVDDRHLHADHPSDRHHRKLVFRDAGELLGRELHDPRAADALGGNGQAPALPRVLERGKLELHTGERKAQRIGLGVFRQILVGTRRQGVTDCRMDRQCSGQVEAQHPEQEEFALLIDPGPLGEIAAQTALRQQVREEGRHDPLCWANLVMRPPGRP
jgi:hypothetical protein